MISNFSSIDTLSKDSDWVILNSMETKQTSDQEIIAKRISYAFEKGLNVMFCIQALPSNFDDKNSIYGYPLFLKNILGN